MVKKTELFFIVGMICMFIIGYYIILTKNHIERYLYYDVHPSVKLYDEEECSICLNPLQDKKIYLKCKHSFHEHCVRKWLEHKQICPICKRDVSL